MKTISARMFLLTGALICLSGCGNILGTGGKSTLYRISSTPVICPLLSGPKLMIFWTTKEI